MPVKQLKSGLKIGTHNIACLSERHPANLPWEKLNVDIVLECTGIFTSRIGAAKHLEAGAKKVLISAPGSDIDLTVVYGVNHKKINRKHSIVSNASCTTNCLAPVAKILNDKFGIVKGHMTTIHAYTGDQNLLDTVHKDPRRARGAALSLVPTSTGAAKAIGLVLPELSGRLEGTAVRVPVPNVSVIDLVCELKKNISVDDINNEMSKASKGPMKGILDINSAPLVSSDFNHNPHSSIFDTTQTQLIGKKVARVMSWYDNEWGFANRMLDVAKAMGKN
jgi:glyceraldehyde 3-phosphate dehydrogenase